MPRSEPGPGLLDDVTTVRAHVTLGDRATIRHAHATNQSDEERKGSRAHQDPTEDHQVHVVDCGVHREGDDGAGDEQDDSEC